MPSLSKRLAALALAPVRAALLLVRGDRWLVEIGDLARRTRKTTEELSARSRRLEAGFKETNKRLFAMESQLQQVHRAVSDRLLHYNLQLGRLSRAQPENGDPAGPKRLSARPIPLEPGPGAPLPWGEVGGGVIHPDPGGVEWMTLTACPVCGRGEGTMVLEWNKLMMLSQAPDPGSERYDYTVCHSCGVVYAAHRPVGKRFLFLLEHFGEVTGKAGGAAKISNPVLNPYPLSDADKADLKRRAARGIFVSEHLGLKKSEYLEALMKDRFQNSVHVDLIGSLVQPHGARVLEMRPRVGTISESLRRLFKADISVMPMFESQKFLLKELYGFDSKGVIDYDHFTIPFEGVFDLIVCNHIFTHTIRPADFLREVRSHLKPGGYLYLYKEPDDRQFLDEGKSIIAHLNPLHMQAFDQASLVRALAANGFEVIFTKSRDHDHLCLARAAAGAVSTAVPWVPIEPERLAARVAAYRQARDRAILRLPPDVRHRVAGEWSPAIERGVDAGALEFDDKGQLKFVANDPSKVAP